MKRGGGVGGVRAAPARAPERARRECAIKAPGVPRAVSESPAAAAAPALAVCMLRAALTRCGAARAAVARAHRVA